MKTKVLHVIGGMGRGGAPSFIINNLQVIDTNKVQFDFLVRNDNCAFTDIIESKGGRLFVVPSFPRHLFSNFIETLKVFRKYGKGYDVIHVHANALYYTLPLLLAKFYGVKKIILHSHNTQSNVSYLRFLHYINKKIVSRLANIFLACGEKAGHWMYGSKSFEVINNAVDVSKFCFSQSARNEIRQEFGLGETTMVLGNVGRFQKVKNHDFLIDIFAEYVKINPDSVLLISGGGTLLEAMKGKAQRLSLADKIIFAGVRSDIEKLYSAMDIFVMPSLFEGLPFVAIEAQCSGLPCLISKNVTEEAFITDLCKVETLNNDAKTWCNDLIELINTPIDRTKYKQVVSDKMYDINYTANRLQEIYTTNI